MSTILVVDDDPYIRELVSAILRNEGFNIIEAADGRAALECFGTEKIDLCVLDVMMPHMDGFEFCRLARKYYDDLPILMLTAKRELSQKVQGFNLGVDDYLVKPFESAELAARIKALMKRYRINASQVLTIGRLRLDKDSYTVEKCETTPGQGRSAVQEQESAASQGQDLAASPEQVPVPFSRTQETIPRKEFELLFCLAGSPGRTLTRNQLIEEVWGYDFDGNERTLDVHIGRLRERFPESGFDFRIATVRGLGYRLEVLA